MDKSGDPFYWDLSTLMKERRSCRNFKANDIEPWRRIVIAKAGESAPYASGGPRRVIVMPFSGKKVSEGCYDQKHVYLAPDAWLVCGKDPDFAVLRSGHPKYVFDVSAAVMLMDIMAVSMGYGTCWIGHFDPNRIRSIYELPDDLIPTMILLVGERNDD